MESFNFKLLFKCSSKLFLPYWTKNDNITRKQEEIIEFACRIQGKEKNETMVYALASAAFLQGILGSLHCMAMCGPITTLLPSKENQSIWIQILYNLSRSVSYASMGAVLGGLGWGVDVFIFREVSTWLGGFLIILLGLNYIYPYWKTGLYLNPYSWKPFQNLLKKTQSNKESTVVFPISMGFLSGILPCGLLLPAYSLALLSGSPWGGFLIMVSFSLGTYPSLLSIGLMGRQMIQRVSNPSLKWFVGFLLILLGIYSIYHRSQSQWESPECNLNRSIVNIGYEFLVGSFNVRLFHKVSSN